MQTSARIRQHILSLKEGEMFTSRDLMNYGLRASIDQTMFRLIQLGLVVQICRGIFMRETESGERPSVEEVAALKAASFCKNIYPYDRTLFKNELDTSAEEMPYIIFMTDGASSSFVYNNQRVYLRGISSSKIMKYKQKPVEAPARNSVLSLTQKNTANPLNSLENNSAVELNQIAAEILNFEPPSTDTDLHYFSTMTVEEEGERKSLRISLAQMPQRLLSKIAWFKPKEKAPGLELLANLSAEALEEVAENR